ncbi:YdcF family protein [Macrococcus lamae]|nr:ElyC/SanA/YdcF family protein [Macrococcus lamae]
MKNFWKILFAAICSLYIILLVVFSFAYFGYNHLLVDDKLGRSDIIIVYAVSNEDELFNTAKKLMNEGYGKKIVISPFVVNSKVDMVHLMKKHDLKKTDVIPDYYSTSMKESAVAVRQLMTKNKYQTALIVANDYEMKRLINTYEKNDTVHFFYHKSVMNNKNSENYSKKAQHEIWQLPRFWLNL